MTDVFDAHTDLTVCGGPVRLYRAGEAGPPLLLLHGGMLDTAQGVWRHVLPHLASDYRVHLVDLPRHGGSRPWSGILDDAFYRQFLDDLLDVLDLPRVAIIGLSLGGGIATGYALDHPERVTALIAIAPGGLGAKRKAQLLTWLAIRTPGAMRMTSRYLARRPESIRRSMLTNLTAGEHTRDFETIVELAIEEAEAKAKHGEPALDDWMTRAYGPFAMRLNLLPALPKLTVPTLWVRGDQDPLVGNTEMAAAAAATPNGRLVTIPGAGHIVTYDQPDEFSQLARGFLAATLDHFRT
ncbi:alpha/beta fold hydrolase [Nocardia donostiensis]|uniref:Alpha/beta hydrolase n=1 Tax=Nocardia donostiensis TaxID=1538463 RepID=A0A1V2TCH4_9NOCA|nr:alpha/beta hydrolase [Nocardia donostiensis]ONM47222.1 alpha/beta hydrolase [Nocardia donostiensis]OQS16526.1 alpha/beta hydrolase [Nocardia donostiensis]OQS21001.1 alpha/beta hydrolase [Nocardia donostiensis]